MASLSPVGETTSLVRVGAVQAGSIVFDTPSTLDKLEALVADGVALGAELLVFPEAFVGGY
ncbi:MAG: nitrilase, partial [bacterium]|nr:nitrilase [bacterium]